MIAFCCLNSWQSSNFLAFVCLEAERAASHQSTLYAVFTRNQHHVKPLALVIPVSIPRFPGETRDWRPMGNKPEDEVLGSFPIPG
jgi:hypothetical protein